jgi:hypothetical protein
MEKRKSDRMSVMLAVVGQWIIMIGIAAAVAALFDILLQAVSDSLLGKWLGLRRLQAFLHRKCAVLGRWSRLFYIPCYFVPSLFFTVDENAVVYGASFGLLLGGVSIFSGPHVAKQKKKCGRGVAE